MKSKKKETLRTCCGCREQKNKAELVRLYLQEGSHVAVDETGKSGGRGVYICRNAECIKKALRSGAIGRGLRQSVSEEEIRTCVQQITDPM